MIHVKYKSRRFWFALWAASCFTSIAAAAIFAHYTATWLDLTLPLLLGVVGGFIGSETILKGKITPNVQANDPKLPQ